MFIFSPPRHLSVLHSSNTTFTRFHKVSVTVVINLRASSPSPVLPHACVGALNSLKNPMPYPLDTDRKACCRYPKTDNFATYSSCYIFIFYIFLYKSRFINLHENVSMQIDVQRWQTTICCIEALGTADIRCVRDNRHHLLRHLRMQFCP